MKGARQPKPRREDGTHATSSGTGSAEGVPQATPIRNPRPEVGFVNHEATTNPQVPSNAFDYSAWVLGFVASVLTFAQLEPARALLATTGIVIGLSGFWILRHRHTIAKWAVPACGFGVVVCLVLMQTVAAGGSKNKATSTPNLSIVTTRAFTPPATTPNSSAPTAPDVIAGRATSAEPATSALPSTDAPQKVVEIATGEIKQAESKTFFHSALRVGVSTVFDNFVVLNLATSDSECSGDPGTGESVIIRDPVGYWYRVVALRLKPNASVTVEVSRGTGISPSGQLCM